MAGHRRYRPEPDPRGRHLAGPVHAKAHAATILRDLTTVAARTARQGRDHLTLHLPEYWHREHEWRCLLTAACGPPSAAA
jgi:hypothetical protein